MRIQKIYKLFKLTYLFFILNNEIINLNIKII